MIFSNLKAAQDLKSLIKFWFIIFILFFKYLFTYLTSPGLSCGTWDLHLYCDLLLVACGIYFPDEGSNPDPLNWEQSLHHWTGKFQGRPRETWMFQVHFKQETNIQKAKVHWSLSLVVLEKILEDPLDCKEIQPVNPKGNQSWIFLGRTDAEAETPILWPPDVKNWFTGKDPDAWKDWRQEEK